MAITSNNRICSGFSTEVVYPVIVRGIYTCLECGLRPVISNQLACNGSGELYYQWSHSGLEELQSLTRASCHSATLFQSQIFDFYFRYEDFFVPCRPTHK